MPLFHQGLFCNFVLHTLFANITANAALTCKQHARSLFWGADGQTPCWGIDLYCSNQNSKSYILLYTRTLVWRWPILQYVSTVSAPGLMFRFSFSMGYYFMQGTSPTTLVERDSVTRFSILSSVKKVYLGSMWKVKTIPRNCSFSRSLFSHYMWSPSTVECVLSKNSGQKYCDTVPLII